MIAVVIIHILVHSGINWIWLPIGYFLLIYSAIFFVALFQRGKRVENEKNG